MNMQFKDWSKWKKRDTVSKDTERERSSPLRQNDIPQQLRKSEEIMQEHWGKRGGIEKDSKGHRNGGPFTGPKEKKEKKAFLNSTWQIKTLNLTITDKLKKFKDH